MGVRVGVRLLPVEVVHDHQPVAVEDAVALRRDPEQVRAVAEVEAEAVHDDVEGRVLEGQRVRSGDLEVATADALPFEDASFDVVVYGFCLYLCDRADLFRIAAECDRVLDGDGLVVVYDFHREQPHANPYAHAPGLFSYKMDHARLFTWNPAFEVVERRLSPYPPDDEVAVTVLRRSVDAAWHGAAGGGPR